LDGLHLIADLYNCRPISADLLTEPGELEAFCLLAVKGAGLSGVAQLFHSFRDAAARDALNAAPVGITGVVLLAESHCAIHTWPEKNAVTLDVYVCNYGQDNSVKARKLLQALLQGFLPGRVDTQEVIRGS
jgi:S-adenosylmethionine decarboxylase